MDIGTFNAAQDDAAAVVLRTCARVEQWVTDLVAARPFADVDSLVSSADALAAAWGAEELEEALADHPRIGERHPGTGRSAALSHDEQSGVDDSAGTTARLAAANRRYEERFGRIFLIRAAGRSSEDVLAHLEQRLRHDPATETRVAADQLREIAVLRLRGAFS